MEESLVINTVHVIEPVEQTYMADVSPEYWSALKDYTSIYKSCGDCVAYCCLLPK